MNTEKLDFLKQILWTDEATFTRTGITKVTIRPVLNGTVPFFESLSRCPLGNLRDAKMSRFQKVDKKNNENKCSLTKYCFYYILFLMCTCVFDVIDREWHLDKITRQQ